MRTEKEDKDPGESLRERILQRMMAEGISPLDAKDAHDEERKRIEEIIAFSKAELKPRLGKNSLLYDSGRSRRCFDAELRLQWLKARACYQRHWLSILDPYDQKLLLDPRNEAFRDELLGMVGHDVDSRIRPMLEEHESPGDDLYHLVNRLLSGFKDEDAVKLLADSGSPLQIQTSLFGIFGLLIQASRYHERRQMDQAYSCLIDASNLIGMNDASTYVMRYLSPVAARRQARKTSAKSRLKKEQIKATVHELYESARPMGGDGKPRRWMSSSEAGGAVWSALTKDLEDPDDLGLKDSTVMKLCRELFKKSP